MGKQYWVIGILVFLVGAVFVISMQQEEQPTPEPVVIEEEPIVGEPEVIGQSVEGRDIVAHTFGTGDTHLLFVGGIHGGYEWNSVLLAYNFIDYLKENPLVIPEDMRISIIPSANPDGVYEILGVEGRFALEDAPTDRDATAPGRFNANDVDLNRNFDCKWAPESTWKGNVVSAGDGPFSEPEARTIRDYVEETNPSAVVFWHSQANAVYASECEEGVLSETLSVMNVYAEAAGYRAVPTFDAYPITGDAEGWLASIGIPSVTVELESHDSIEWERNRAGFEALLSYYSNKDTAR